MLFIRYGSKETSRYDAVVLDMGNPWDVLDKVYNILKHGACVAIYQPTTPQVSKVLSTLSKLGFIDIKVYEVLVREWKSIPEELRPETWYVAHTGFIIIAKKP